MRLTGSSFHSSHGMQWMVVCIAAWRRCEMIGLAKNQILRNWEIVHSLLHFRNFGFQDFWAFGSQEFWISGFWISGFWIFGFLDFWIPDFSIFGLLDLWNFGLLMFGFLDFWNFGFPIFGILDFWIPDVSISDFQDFLDAWFLDFWIFGFLDWWISGFSDFMFWVLAFLFFLDFRIFAFLDFWIFAWCDDVWIFWISRFGLAQSCSVWFSRQECLNVEWFVWWTFVFMSRLICPFPCVNISHVESPSGSCKQIGLQDLLPSEGSYLYSSSVIISYNVRESMRIQTSQAIGNKSQSKGRADDRWDQKAASVRWTIFHQAVADACMHVHAHKILFFESVFKFIVVGVLAPSVTYCHTCFSFPSLQLLFVVNWSSETDTQVSEYDGSIGNKRIYARRVWVRPALRIVFLRWDACMEWFSFGFVFRSASFRSNASFERLLRSSRMTWDSNRLRS